MNLLSVTVKENDWSHHSGQHNIKWQLTSKGSICMYTYRPAHPSLCVGLPLCRHAVSMNSRCLSYHYHLPLLHRERIPISVKLKQIVKQRILGFKKKKRVQNPKRTWVNSSRFSLSKGKEQRETALCWCFVIGWQVKTNTATETLII